MKSIIKNFLIIILGIIVPVYLPYLLEDRYSTEFIVNLRIVSLIVVIIASVFLFVINFRAKKDKTAPYFILISIGSILYFSYALLVTLAFRNFTGL